MGKISPGGFGIVDQAIAVAGLNASCQLLEIGCGEGDTLAHLAELTGCRCTGIDQSETQIEEGRKKLGNSTLIFGDALQCLIVIDPKRFDAILIECVLSTASQPERLLTEAYRILKPGGHIILTDLCDRRNPAHISRVAGYSRSLGRDGGDHAAGTEKGTATDDRCEGNRAADGYEMGRMDHATVNARKAGNTSDSAANGRKAGLCIHDATVDGAIDLSGLVSVCGDLGFRTVLLQDKTRDLDAFVAEKIWAHGSLDAWFAAVTEEGIDAEAFCKASPNDRRLGYFLVIMAKPAEPKSV